MRWGSNTLVRLDKRLFDIFKDMGVNIDAEIFKEAYTRRMIERNNNIVRLQQEGEGQIDGLIGISLNQLASKPKRRKKENNVLLIHQCHVLELPDQH